jgi:hypothetical protein
VTLAPVGTTSASSSSISSGAIAGIVIGSVVGAAMLIGIGVLLYRHQPNNVAPVTIASGGENIEQKRAAADTVREAQEIPSSRLQYPEDILSGRLGEE